MAVRSRRVISTPWEAGLSSRLGESRRGGRGGRAAGLCCAFCQRWFAGGCGAGGGGVVNHRNKGNVTSRWIEAPRKAEHLSRDVNHHRRNFCPVRGLDETQ